MFRMNFKFISRPLRIKGVSIKRVNIFLYLNKRGSVSMKHLCIYIVNFYGTDEGQLSENISPLI